MADTTETLRTLKAFVDQGGKGDDFVAATVLENAGYIASLIRLQAAEIEQLKAENADLKSSVAAFAGPRAAEYARSLGWPDGHLHPTHYDILAKAGARMVDFVRHPLPAPPQDGSAGHE